MMEANIENNELDQDEVAAQQEQEQQRVNAAVTKQRHLTIDSILKKKRKFPLRNRKKIDVLINEFLEKLGDDIHKMLCENEFAEADTYDGLDSDRDTEEEVETAIRFFPDVLSGTTGDLHYPIKELAIARGEDDGYWQCKVKTVFFIPIVARLAIEFDLFEEDERGGLLCEYTGGDNILHLLMYTDQTILTDQTTKRHHQEQHEVVEDKFFQVLIKLRQLDLLKKEDIQSYDLLHKLCQGYFFPEKRFKMLVEWDPNALTQTDRFGELPFNEATIQGFRFVFEYGIRYFPKKKGISLLFRKQNYGGTTFQHVCSHFGYKKVMKVIVDTLACYSNTPVNVPEALLSAALDENVHLDGVFFLLRRDPDLLLKLLPQLLPSSSSSAPGSPNDNDDDNKSRISSKKRKRKTTTATSTTTRTLRPRQR